MISWIQRYFQHHFKTVFAVLLTVTIISFVFVISSSGGLGRGDRRQIADRPFFDYNLSLPEDQARVFGDAQVSVSLKLGAFGGIDPEQIQNYALARATALHLAQQWHIPAATPAEIAEEIKTLRMFAGPDGQFDAKQYATFRDNLKTNPRGYTEADIARVLGDDIRAEKVNKLLAGPGYVLPADIKSYLQRFETTWTVGTATVDYASFKVDLKPTDAELTQFFEQSGGRYDIPPRAVVNYTEFASSAFLPGVTVTDAEVRAYYDENPARFPKPAVVKPADATAPATPPKPDPAADFAAVRSAAEASLKLERAQKLAVRAASDLTLQLFEKFKNKQPDPAALESFLATRNLPLKSAPPFTQEAVPGIFGGSPDVGDAAFKLGPQQFASEAFPTPAGAAVLFWKDTQASHKPLFTEVREKVLADYLENEKRKRFVELGRTIKSQLEARLKAGDSLEKAAAAVNAGVKLEAKLLAPFSPRTRPQDVDSSVLGALDRLDKGQLSDMAISADKGTFVYVVDRKAPVLDESNPRYVETRTQLATRAAQVGGQSYIAELLEKERKKSEPKLQ